eukprot:364763-Chlamydomonas_euryale.AAC.2
MLIQNRTLLPVTIVCFFRRSCWLRLRCDTLRRGFAETGDMVLTLNPKQGMRCNKLRRRFAEQGMRCDKPYRHLRNKGGTAKKSPLRSPGLLEVITLGASSLLHAHGTLRDSVGAGETAARARLAAP